MYKIVLVSKIIKRNNIPCNRELNGKISNISRKELGMYESESVPRVGDIIWFTDNCYYDVLCVIRYIDKSPVDGSNQENYIILEVKEHSNRYLYAYGSDSWIEEIPLVTEIDNDI